MGTWQIASLGAAILLAAAILAWIVALPVRSRTAVRNLLILAGVVGVAGSIVGFIVIAREAPMMPAPFAGRWGLIALGVVLLAASVLAWIVRMRSKPLRPWVRLPLTLGGALAGAYGAVLLAVVLSPGS